MNNFEKTPQKEVPLDSGVDIEKKKQVLLLSKIRSYAKNITLAASLVFLAGACGDNKFTKDLPGRPETLSETLFDFHVFLQEKNESNDCMSSDLFKKLEQSSFKDAVHISDPLLLAMTSQDLKGIDTGIFFEVLQLLLKDVDLSDAVVGFADALGEPIELFRLANTSKVSLEKYAKDRRFVEAAKNLYEKGFPFKLGMAGNSLGLLYKHREQISSDIFNTFSSKYVNYFNIKRLNLGDPTNFDRFILNFESFSMLEKNIKYIGNETKHSNPLSFFTDSTFSYDRIDKLGLTVDSAPLGELVGDNRTDRFNCVLRNMEYAGADPTEDNFNIFFNDIEKVRSNEGIRKRSVFHKRSVLGLFHDEKIIGGDNRFGRKKLKSKINQQKPLAFHEFRAKEGRPLLEAKKDFYSALKTVDFPTIYADVHGSPEHLFLSGGQIEEGGFSGNTEDLSVSLEDFFKCLVDRVEIQKNTTNIIIIDDGCFSFNFVNHLFDKVTKYNKNHSIKIPLLFGFSAADFGQASLSSNVLPFLGRNKTGSTFFDSLFDGENGENGFVNIGDFIEHELEPRKNTTNTSLFLNPNPKLWPETEAEILSNQGPRKTVPYMIIG